MDEIMNVTTEINEVTTDLSESNLSQDIVTEETSSGPSIGFTALIVGGIAGAAIALTVAIKRHKKKKAEVFEQEEFYSDIDDESAGDVEAKDVSEEQDKFEEKSTNKK